MKGCPRFIYILKLLVDDLETNDVIGWNERGDSLTIRDRNRLSEVLLRYPCSKNFATFHRQLNLYGFKQTRCLKSKENAMSYKHKYFLRNNIENIRKIQRCVEEIKNEDVSTQTDYILSNTIKDESELRVNVLEQVIESMREEIVDLRTGFNSLHTKLTNQQNLFYAVFRAMNTSQNNSDVLFNVFLKQENLRSTNVGASNLSNTNFSIYPSIGNRERRQILPVEDNHIEQKNQTQTIEQTYEVINNNFNNNPAFCYDYPIFVTPPEDVDNYLQPQCNSVHSMDSLLNAFNDNNDQSEVD